MIALLFFAILVQHILTEQDDKSQHMRFESKIDWWIPVLLFGGLSLGYIGMGNRRREHPGMMVWGSALVGR